MFMFIVAMLTIAFAIGFAMGHMKGHANGYLEGTDQIDHIAEHYDGLLEARDKTIESLNDELMFGAEPKKEPA